MTMRFLTTALVLLAALATPGSAQDREVPYWATIKTDELNMRVGPSVEYKVAWVYKRKGLPVKVIRVTEGWRRIRDHEGDEGWVTANLLSAERGGLVVGEGLVAMRETPSESGKLKWNLQPGVVGKLGECNPGWCELDVAGRAGWVRADRLWGASKP
jgi:SH3-like domain-containing protein